MDVLTNALEIASRGFPVFPVRLCPDACLRAVYARRKRLRTAFTTRHRTRSKSGGIGRSRAYELMAIADGRTTLEKVRTSTNECRARLGVEFTNFGWASDKNGICSKTTKGIFRFKHQSQHNAGQSLVDHL